jgi:hypothetical protein
MYDGKPDGTLALCVTLSFQVGVRKIGAPVGMTIYGAGEPSREEAGGVGTFDVIGSFGGTTLECNCGITAGATLGEFGGSTHSI